MTLQDTPLSCVKLLYLVCYVCEGFAAVRYSVQYHAFPQPVIRLMLRCLNAPGTLEGDWAVLQRG